MNRLLTSPWRFALPLVGALAVHAAPAAEVRVEQAGIAVTLSTRTAGGDSGAALAELRFTDAATGAPLSGLRPAAWMQLRRSPADLETPCEDRARSFVAGSLGSRADVDLNAYRLVSLNQDASVTFINPQVRIRNSRLEAVVTLPGPGHDWAHDAQHHRLAITLRDQGQLAVVDSATHRLLGVVDLGPGSQPTRLVMDSDGRHAWVGLDGARAVVQVDLQSQREVRRVAVGAGPHLLASVPGRPWLVVTHAADGQATLIDTDSARVLGRVAVGAGPVALAYSEAAQRAVVLAGQSGALVLLALDAEGLRVDARIPLEPGALSMALLEDGRQVLVGNVQRHEVSLVDLARRQLRASLPVAPWPDQIVTTRGFAYVRSQTTSRVTLLSLDQARAGRLQPLEVAMGRGAAADLPQALNVAPLMVAAPEGDGIYAAVAADAQTYRYNEGLMVPSGSLTNYRRASRGLMVIDESLQERDTGRFEAPLRPNRSGTYDVVVRNGSPALTACLSLPLQAVAPDRRAAEAAELPPPRATLLGWTRQGQGLQVEVALHDAGGRAITSGDLQLLVFGPGGSWQRRGSLQPSPQGPWRGQVDLPPGADPSQAQLLIQSQALGLTFNQGRLGALGAERHARR